MTARVESFGGMVLKSSIIEFRRGDTSLVKTLEGRAHAPAIR